MRYDLDYFIQKFKDIPEEYMGLSSDDNPTDAWEWCDLRESEILYRIVKPFGLLLWANDGIYEYHKLGVTPKQRVVNFLEYIKAERSPYFYYEVD